MGPDWNAFERIVAAIVARHLAQASEHAPVAAVTRFAAQLRQVVATRGLPLPLAAGEVGAPGGLSDDVCAPLVAAVMAGVDAPRMADAARQLIKACLYPEFTICRDSYREVSREGACRRQELSRARGRVSGAHCVDCPHWIALAAPEHEALLATAWHGDRSQLAQHREVFLPEDFRALRRWLHAAARGA